MFQLDDWVLCRIYKKKNTTRSVEQKEEEDWVAQTLTADDASGSQTFKFPRPCSINNLWELDCLGSISQLLNDNAYNSSFDGNFARPIEKLDLGEMSYQYSDSVKLQMNQSSSLNQQIFLNPVFEFQ